MLSNSSGLISSNGSKASSSLLEENNLKKFDLVVGTMNNFYVNDNENIELCDDGFDKFFEGLFPKTSNITMK